MEVRHRRDVAAGLPIAILGAWSTESPSTLSITTVHTPFVLHEACAWNVSEGAREIYVRNDDDDPFEYIPDATRRGKYIDPDTARDPTNRNDHFLSARIQYGRSFDSLLRRGGMMVFSEKGGERKNSRIIKIV